MDLIDAIKTTGACRHFKPDPVPDDVWHASSTLPGTGRKAATASLSATSLCVTRS
jgi:hypothetical protein